MMARHSILRATGVVSIFGAAGPALDEVGLSAWIAQAAPGETLVYHRGFLAVDATSVEEEDVERLRSLGLSDEDVAGVVLAAAARCFFSKTLDGLGVEPGVRHGFDELPEHRGAGRIPDLHGELLALLQHLDGHLPLRLRQRQIRRGDLVDQP